jgi:hypothetical protein
MIADETGVGYGTCRGISTAKFGMHRVNVCKSRVRAPPPPGRSNLLVQGYRWPANEVNIKQRAVTAESACLWSHSKSRFQAMFVRRKACLQSESVMEPREGSS